MTDNARLAAIEAGLRRLEDKVDSMGAEITARMSEGENRRAQHERAIVSEWANVSGELHKLLREHRQNHPKKGRATCGRISKVG